MGGIDTERCLVCILELRLRNTIHVNIFAMVGWRRHLAYLREVDVDLAAVAEELDCYRCV